MLPWGTLPLPAIGQPIQQQPYPPGGQRHEGYDLGHAEDLAHDLFRLAVEGDSQGYHRQAGARGQKEKEGQHR